MWQQLKSSFWRWEVLPRWLTRKDKTYMMPFIEICLIKPQGASNKKERSNLLMSTKRWGMPANILSSIEFFQKGGSNLAEISIPCWPLFRSLFCFIYFSSMTRWSSNQKITENLSGSCLPFHNFQQIWFWLYFSKWWSW